MTWKTVHFFSERETFQCGLASSSNGDLIIIVVVIIIITIFIIVITIIIVIITIIIIVIKSDVSERRPDHQTPEQRWLRSISTATFIASRWFIWQDPQGRTFKRHCSGDINEQNVDCVWGNAEAYQWLCLVVWSPYYGRMMRRAAGRYSGNGNQNQARRSLTPHTMSLFPPLPLFPLMSLLLFAFSNIYMDQPRRVSDRTSLFHCSRSTTL